MPKIKDVLLKAGYTEEELKGMETLLSNPRFASSVQGELDRVEALEADIKKKQDVIDGDTKWYNETCVPNTDKLIQEIATARAEAAAAKARLQALKDAGLVKDAEGADDAAAAAAAAKAAAASSNSIDESRFVTREQLGKAYLDVGDTVIMAADITDEHRELFGKRLPGGMAALRKDFQDALEHRTFNGTIRDFWAHKYNVPGRLDELKAADQKAHDDAIRQEERSKIASERGNPMTSPMLPSRNPFTNRTVSVDAAGNKVSGDAQRPWEKNPEARSGDRVSKFTKQVLTSSVQ